MTNLNYLFITGVAAFVFVVGGWFFLRMVRRYNTIDWGIPWLNLVDGLLRWLCLKYHRLGYQNIPLPENGCAIVAANHISGLDPFLLIAASARPLRFLIAREEYERFGLRWLFRAAGCIPVERSGRPERALREAKRRLEQGEVVAIFPHGGIHLDSDPPRKLKAGVLRLSQLGKCPIYPVRLQGVGGAGKVAMAVLLRGNAQLLSVTPLQCVGADDCDCLDKLAAVFSGK